MDEAVISGVDVEGVEGEEGDSLMTKSDVVEGEMPNVWREWEICGCDSRGLAAGLGE